ncbi:hypothetical protein DF3PA_90095 [Candidatus Defluviicoccus seviourii]|uniref:Uncharacterized protein n=1 Tax=Candidatus Defluviicoccus seviourii TaxID=2565273 RepID=A0A564WJ86_9PROT|nr:hypothetical protein DF3PA_90095 [Candidatus Defluviicoccus seviourii]
MAWRSIAGGRRGVARVAFSLFAAGRMGDSLAVEFSALDRAALVRIQVPQPRDDEAQRAPEKASKLLVEYADHPRKRRQVLFQGVRIEFPKNVERPLALRIGVPAGARRRFECVLHNMSSPCLQRRERW